MSQQTGGPGSGAFHGAPEPSSRAELPGVVADSRPAPGSAENRPGPGGADHRLAPGPPRLLALAAAGIGLLIYVLGFVGEFSVSNSFGGPMLVGGGLLAATAVLPRAGRVLAPAAVLISLGMLLLLQLVVAIGGPSVVIIALVLAFLETAAVVAALLLDTGLVTTAAPGRRRAAPFGPSQQGYGGMSPQVGGPPGYGQQGASGGRYGLPPEGFGPPQGHTAPPAHARPEEPGTPGYGFPAAAGAPPGPSAPPSHARPDEPSTPGYGSPVADLSPRPWYFGPDRVSPGAEPAAGTGAPASDDSTTLFPAVDSPAAGSAEPAKTEGSRAAESTAADPGRSSTTPNLSKSGQHEPDSRTGPPADSERTQVFPAVERPPAD